MPRAVDRRDIQADNDPTRSGTEFHFGAMLGDELEILRRALEQAAENLKGQVIEFIKGLTGLDLASPEALFLSLTDLVMNGPENVQDFIRSIINNIASAFITGGPVIESFARNFFTAVSNLDNVPVIGDIDEAIESAFESIEKFLRAFQGINLSGDPGAILTAITAAITDALKDVPVIGDIVKAITGIVGGGLPDLEQWAQKVPLLNAIGGFLSSGVIPGLDASKIISGQFAQSMVNLTSVAGSIITGLLSAANIPGIDASKITSGQFAQAMVNLTAIPGSLISSVIAAARIPNLDASKITTGQFAQSMVNLTSIAGSLISGLLSSANIPGLDASKITSGQFAQALVAGLPTALANLSTDAQTLIDAIFQGIFGGSLTGRTPAQIKAGLAAFPGGNIVGSILSSVVPGLDASKITSGQFAQSMVNLTSIGAGLIQGVLTAANIPSLNASKITAGLFGTSLIPGLDASKITSGQFAQSMITDLAADLSDLVADIADKITSGQWTELLGAFGGSTVTDVVTRLNTFLTGNSDLNAAKLVGLVASLIPGLDASKITSGQFPQSMLNITSVAGSLISGLLSAANIPGLDASKITGGLFGVARIPNLGRSKIIGTNDLTNLLEDGGFESPDTVNPGNATVVTITDPAVGGTKALQQISTGGNVDSTIQPSIIDVKEGQYLYIKGRIRKLTTGTTGQTGVYLTATLDGASPNYPGFTAVPGGLHAPAFTLNELVQNVWTSYEGIYQIPAGKNRIQIRPSIRSSVPAGQTIQHDDLEVREVTMSRSIIDEIAAAWGQSGQSLTTIFNNVPGAKLVGQVAAAIIPGLDASKITSGQFAQSMVNLTSVAANLITGALAAANIPGLDASKITSGQFAQSMVNITSIAANLISGALAAVNIPGLDASKITSGTFAQSMVNITSIAGSLISSVLSAANIPGLDASKINAGTFGDARIPNLNASKVTAGLFPMARIGINDFENLVGDGGFESDTTMPWSIGTGRARVTDQAHSGTGSYCFSAGASGASFTGGTIELREGDMIYAEAWVRKDADFNATDARIRMAAGRPEGDANMANLYFRPSDINTAAAAQGVANTDTWVKVSGTFGPYPANTFRMVLAITMTNLTAGNLWIDDIVIRRVKPAVTIADLPGTKIISQVLASIVPALDASKITSGQFAQSMVNITSVAANLISGALALANIPGLPGSQITSGSVAAARIASLDASKITTGQFPQTMVNLTSIAANLISGVLTAGNIPTLPQSKITDLTVDLGTAVANAGDALTTATGWVTAFFNGITGQTQTNVPVADAQAQAAALAETQAALAAAVAALQNTNDGGTNQGVAGIDEFDRVAGADLGGTGFWEVVHEVGTASNGNVDIHDGTQVDWHDAGNAFHRIHFRCTNPAFATTLTDYQKVTLTSGTIAAESQLPFDGGSQTWRIRVRENAAKTQYVFVEIGFTGKAQWGYRNGGSETLVGTQFDCPLPTPGSYYTVEAGLPSGVRYFRLRRNGVAIGNVFNDTGAVTALGSNNRGHGFDMQAAPRGGTGQSTPAAVGSYSVADNVPPTVIGRGLQVYRSNTAGANMAAGDQTVPNAFFDMVEASTADITWSAATSTATVNATDWYTIDFNFRTSVDISRDQALSALIYQNGAIKRRGQSTHASVGTSSNPAGSAWNVGAPIDLSVCKTLYLPAGSTIKPGWYRTATANGSAPGNANGDFANMTIVRGKQ